MYLKVGRYQLGSIIRGVRVIMDTRVTLTLDTKLLYDIYTSSPLPLSVLLNASVIGIGDYSN